VQVGAASDDRIEILRGVALGDTVVASATFLVDAESNLGTALGGMGDMPGMEITVPPTSTPSRAPADPGSRPAPRPARPMPDMRMPDTSGTSGTPGTPGTPGRPNPTEPLPSTATRGGETHAGHGGR
jgi:Cu(I)/Ag(I) efflux system membrane fusion protein